MLFVLLLISNIARADCLSLVKGPIVMDVEACENVDPTKFDLNLPQYKFIKDLDGAGRNKFYDTYRGFSIKGHVIKSDAIHEGLEKSKGALKGEHIGIFSANKKLPCDMLKGKRVFTQLQEVCCNGSGDAPCLLDTSYTMLDIKVLGNNQAGTGDAKHKKAINSSEYIAGNKFYVAKNYKLAAENFEKAFAKKEIDITGLYRLGNSYYSLDQCRKSIKPLKAIYDAQGKGEVWEDDAKTVRLAVFLLARCHSKLNEPQNAVFYLNGYLLEADKFQAEIALSLKHKDFGWIHTSKDYLEYKSEAEKKLRAPRK